MTWKNKALLLGVSFGALSGLGAALLYIRSVEDIGSEAPSKIGTRDALKMAMGVLNLVKQVSSLSG